MTLITSLAKQLIHEYFSAACHAALRLLHRTESETYLTCYSCQHYSVTVKSHVHYLEMRMHLQINCVCVIKALC